MSKDNIEQTALLSKSLALIEKTIVKIEQMDTTMFPSETSAIATDILLESLRTLRKSDLGEPMPRHSLFRSLISIQSLVDDLELSHIDSVSWPIARYCDTMWAQIFSENGPRIFYSTTRKYNYNIVPFSNSLRSSLRLIMPKAEVSRIIDKEIYCLHLASLEHDNLSLYANIAHEFGHAMYSSEPDITELWKQSFTTVLNILMGDHDKPATSQRQRLKILNILQSLAKELFADSFAAFTFGPSFFLSLYEMTWGNQRNSWDVILSPKDPEISAHPSGNYRLDQLKKHLGLGGFIKEAKVAFERLDSEHLRSMVVLFEKIPIGDADGVVNVAPASDSDREEISDSLNKRLPEIKKACHDFAEKCWPFLRDRYSQLESKTTVENISHLLERLENGVLPNIIPDGTLLGIPAEFEDILLASAMYRMSLLLPEAEVVDSKKTRDDLRKLERLARKSFEATWIQKKFKEWKTDESE